MNADRVVSEFEKYFSDVRANGSGNYKTFIVKRNSNADKTAMMMRYLVEQNILVEQAASDTRANGFDYTSGKEGCRVQIKKGDFVISANNRLKFG